MGGKNERGRDERKGKGMKEKEREWQKRKGNERKGKGMKALRDRQKDTYTLGVLWKRG